MFWSAFSPGVPIRAIVRREIAEIAAQRVGARAHHGGVDVGRHRLDVVPYQRIEAAQRPGGPLRLAAQAQIELKVVLGLQGRESVDVAAAESRDRHERLGDVQLGEVRRRIA